ncbi:hypothetical protein QBZ16_001022 [Prototheca wickerhamii]|uniref:MI domain-containing protein n=1 Tax=Prototheca wickerhamii TaxID=3111 RepID=A0AAD9IFB6_PROWI|nr:hypothetical protein QBZ16_001022 [Prototheca wickerhamii]
MKKPASRTAPVDGLERLSSQPFLTDDQRAVLDATLAKKQTTAAPEVAATAGSLTAIEPSVLLARSPSGGRAAPHPAPQQTKREAAHDRHLQRRGKGLGRTKKSGAGGRFTWGGLLAEEEGQGLVALDRRDPNYDSEEESVRRAELAYWRDAAGADVQRFKAGVNSALEEYYDTADPLEVAACLADLDQPQYGWWFVKRALQLGLDGHDHQRELTSVLLAALTGEALTAADVERGFREAAAQLEDTSLDVPNAPELLALFACRAVVDDALPPAFLRGLAPEAADDGAPSATTRFRLSRCWGTGHRFDLDESKAALGRMLDEYAASRDAAEVRALLQQLGLPFFHHELVKQALVRAIDAEREEPWAGLLRSLAEAGAVSGTQMAKGFQRVAEGLADLELDAPLARRTLEALARRAEAEGWLDKGESGAGDGVSQTFPTTSITTANGHAPSRSPSQPATPTSSVAEFKRRSKTLLLEYFDAGDRDEVARTLREWGDPGFGHLFVKLAATLALDHKDRERELVSELLAALVPGTISQAEACRGFQALLAQAEELSLDVPDAEPLLALFLGRAVVDEVIPPRFLTEMLRDQQRQAVAGEGEKSKGSEESAGGEPASPLSVTSPRASSIIRALRPLRAGVRVVEHTRAHLAARHSAERLQTCWHQRVESTAQLALAMRDIVAEYLSSRDAVEAERCLADLSVPHFLHEFVVRALLGACALRENEAPIVELLDLLSGTGLLTETQMVLGFSRVERDMEDLKLDYPLAPEILPDLKAIAAEHKWVPAA